ncbi:DUF2730 family protein [Vibrio parahaemolyticus]|nr:DUF2730 family protein [Vibrio parahaemolyticus]MDF5005682.1 DUF2730 family protein [Vibrio parahaemolyticus]
MDIDWVKGWWPILWAGVLTTVQVIQLLLAKTYARREELEQVRRKMDELQTQVDGMPTQEQVTQMLLEMANTRGEMKELRAQMKPIEHMAQLLLEQRLNDDK